MKTSLLMEQMVRDTEISAGDLIGVPLVFAHIPKTGGTTLNNLLLRQYPRDLTFVMNDSNPRESVDAYRSIPKDLRKIYQLIIGHGAATLRQDIPQPYCMISLLRDPIERVVSFYYYAREKHDHPLKNDILSQGLTLEDMIQQKKSSEMLNYMVFRFSGKTWRDYTDPNPEEAYDLAVENLETYWSLVGTLEQFDEFLFLLAYRYGWTAPYYDRKNENKQKPLLDELSASSINVIQEVNQLDIRFYNFVKTRFTKQLEQLDRDFHSRMAAFKSLNSTYMSLPRNQQNF